MVTISCQILAVPPGIFPPNQRFPNLFARGPLLASKNNRESSQPFSRKYRVSGRQVSNLKTCVTELIMHILRLQSSFFRLTQRIVE